MLLSLELIGFMSTIYLNGHKEKLSENCDVEVLSWRCLVFLTINDFIKWMLKKKLN